MRLQSSIILALLGFYVFVGIVFANPVPWDPSDSFLSLEPIQYFSIVMAEFCALVVGTAVLYYNNQAQWQRAALIMFIALIVSYLLGVAVWITTFQSGILPFSISNPISLTVLLLPEIIGILIGTFIIEKFQKTTWKTAVAAMTAAMTTSLAIGIVLAIIHLALMSL